MEREGLGMVTGRAREREKLRMVKGERGRERETQWSGWQLGEGRTVEIGDRG